MGRKGKTTNYNKKVRRLEKQNQNKKSRGGNGTNKAQKTFLEKRMESKVKNWGKSSILVKRLQDAEDRARMFSAGENEETNFGSENKNREAENTKRQFRKELHKVMACSDVIVQVFIDIIIMCGLFHSLLQYVFFSLLSIDQLDKSIREEKETKNKPNQTPRKHNKKKVLDARDPDSCRCRAIEREVIASRKKLILLLNKVDLVPKEVMLAWQKTLQREFPTLAFKCGTRRGANETAAEHASESYLKSSSAVLGADSLLQLLKNYARSASGAKKAIAVGIVGYPNVGKSSVINSLKRAQVVKTGGTAGVTRAVQEVVLDSKVRLIDSPGVVFSGNSEDPSVVLRNAVKVECLKDPVSVVEAMTAKLTLPALITHFFPTGENAQAKDAHEFLLRIAQNKGQLKKGGVPDIVRAAVLVLVPASLRGK